MRSGQLLTKEELVQVITPRNTVSTTCGFLIEILFYSGIKCNKTDNYVYELLNKNVQTCVSFNILLLVEEILKKGYVGIAWLSVGWLVCASTVFEELQWKLGTQDQYQVKMFKDRAGVTLIIDLSLWLEQDPMKKKKWFCIHCMFTYMISRLHEDYNQQMWI